MTSLDNYVKTNKQTESYDPAWLTPEKPSTIGIFRTERVPDLCQTRVKRQPAKSELLWKKLFEVAAMKKKTKTAELIKI